MITFIYTVLVFLVLRFSVTLFNFLSNPKLGHYGRRFTDKVSILVKTNGSEARLNALMDSIKQQDYENIEVIIVKDNASINEATGRYFLFLEENTQISKGFIHSLVYRTKVFNLALLSIVPTQINTGFRANCIYPLSDFLLLNFFPLRLVRLVNHPVFAAASESCLFFDAALYRQHNWHMQLKGTASEAIELVRLVKQEQLKADVLLGNRLIFVAQGPEKPELPLSDVLVKQNAANLKLFSRRLLLSFNNYLIVALIYSVLVIAGPVVMLVYFEPAFSILPLGLIFLTRIMISFLSAQNPVKQLALHPLQMLVFLYLVLNSIWQKVFRA